MFEKCYKYDVLAIKRKKGEKDNESTQPDPKVNALQIGVTWPREILRNRIDERLDTRLSQGMIDEVRNYLENGGSAEEISKLGLEYKHIAMYLNGEYGSYDEFRNALAHAIKRFAKRQMTWFRRDSDIHWIDMTGNYYDDACTLIDSFLAESE